MKVVFSNLAKRELEDATNFYEMEFEGLGKQFFAEVKKAALRISEYPKAWAVERGEVRKCLYRDSLTSFCTPLSKIIFMSLRLPIDTESLTTGLKEMKHNKSLNECQKFRAWGAVA